ncbi:ubiquitin carboxyl-terminal hydrolase [Musa troglodytarum]|uniref:Ubiquitin carboxyl-terminal hydrolase n=1 Tax=Musa troglodytarum TaxID=320322 RepID=A0A9E7K6M5_9LILI|nr:ubiquitin carboxyl-terminal hydrolase [Musa troglodytarum]
MAPNSVRAQSWCFSPPPPPPPVSGQPRVVGAALVNLGNTCFLNAVLQCLTHTVPLVQMIRKTDHSASHHGDDAGFCSFCALKAHINGCLFLSRLVVSPTYLAQNLSKISPHFGLGQQEDAHEFLHSFLDNVHARCLGRTAADRPASLEEDSIVKQVFGGRLRSQLRCCSCGHCSDTFEPLLDLSLEIDNVGSVGNALESFTKLERIDDPEVRFTCDGCQALVSMEKQLKLDRAPQVLALHLKRFKNDGSFSNKIDDFVEYPLELDLNPCLSCPAEEVRTKYDLYAVLVHVGSAHSGHYFCYIRSSPSTWHLIDDSQVVSVSEGDALEQQAYVLFYIRRGSSCWFSNFMEEEEEKALDAQTATGTSPASVLEHAERCSASSSGSANACSGPRGTPERNEDAGPCNSASPLSPGPDACSGAKRQACHARTPPRTFNQWHDYELDDEPPEDDDLLPLYEMEFKATKVAARKPAAAGSMNAQFNRLVRNMPKSRRKRFVDCINSQQKCSRKRPHNSRQSGGLGHRSPTAAEPSTPAVCRSLSPRSIKRGLF